MASTLAPPSDISVRRASRLKWASAIASLAPFSRLALLTEMSLGGASVEAIADAYAGGGWRRTPRCWTPLPRWPRQRMRPW